jgi:hypothetical protein
MDLACFLSDYFDYQCGNVWGKSDCVNILECSDDVSTHLSRCHLSREKLCKYELILLCCRMFDISHDQLQHMRICPNHRYNLGKFWRRSHVCQYPLHTGSNSAVMGNHVITLQLTKDAHLLFGKTVPIGSRKYLLSWNRFLDFFL